MKNFLVGQSLRQVFRDHKVPHLFGALFAFWVPVIIFLKLAGEVVERDHIGIDTAVLEWLHSYATPWLDALFLFFTSLGGVVFILATVVVIGMYLAYKKQYANLFLILFGVGGAGIANIVLKLLFQRDRPALWEQLVTETSYSFPSGHAMISSALILSLIVMAWYTKWRIPVLGIGVFFIGMIGISRMYLGVHYPTDIVAGWAASALWITIVMWILGLLRSTQSSKRVKRASIR